MLYFHHHPTSLKCNVTNLIVHTPLIQLHYFINEHSIFCIADEMLYTNKVNASTIIMSYTPEDPHAESQLL